MTPLLLPLNLPSEDLSQPTPNSPLISSYNSHIRPLLDAIDSLRTLDLTPHCLSLPTIVVVGDQSSGKSSVLESLAGISLPRGQGICTRVPLIMRLMHQPDPGPPAIWVEYAGRAVRTDEARVVGEIQLATRKIAGDEKGISKTPITLVVKKKGVPDLTMVDLPGITRVPVCGQPENVYELVKEMIMEYITPEETVILNVLPATVDFATCESIMLSQSVDKTGERTLAVVTKADLAPEGLYEKVTNDDVKIGSGQEFPYKDGLLTTPQDSPPMEKPGLLRSYTLFRRIDSIPVLAQSLVRTPAMAANVIYKFLPKRSSPSDEPMGTKTTDVGPHGLDVKVGLGYVCVRNRVGKESYEEARVEELRLFGSHPLLSRIPKSMVGIPVLAHKLVQIQASIISKCLPTIVSQINDKLNANVMELKKMPKNLSCVAEAMVVFVGLMEEVKESLNKIMIRREYDEYPDDFQMHCTARLADMLNRYSEELQCSEDQDSAMFLMEEVRVLEEAKGIGLPNFPPHSVFSTLLKGRIRGISSKPVSFVNQVWDYVEMVVITVLNKHCENYPQLFSSARNAASRLIARTKEESMRRAVEGIEMEKLVDYTCNPDYSSTCDRLMSCKQQFREVVENETKPPVVEIEGFGMVDVGHLRKVKHVAQDALDMKMRMVAYWRIVLRRLVDCMALHLMFTIQNSVCKELVGEIVKELMSPCGEGFERMMEENPSVAAKREKLNRSIKLLKDSREVVSKIISQTQVE